MTLEECYSKFDGDYNAVKMQLGSDTLIEKFMLKFPAEGSMQKLRDAAAAGDVETAFKAAHNLKGVSANLAFKAFNTAVSDLTEQLRPIPESIDQKLLERVNENYALIINTIKAYEEEKK